MVSEEIPIQRKYNIINMEIEKGDEDNENVNEEKYIECDEQGLIDVYVID